MIARRTLTLTAGVVAAGAVGTLAVAVASGMRGADLWGLFVDLVLASLVTVAAVVAARPLLRRASMRRRFAAVALMGAGMGLMNLFVLTRLMFLSSHDATVVAVLLVYALGAGVAAAMALAGSSAIAVDRLARAAARVGDGDLDARAGDLEGGAELEALGRALDRMSARLKDARVREQAVEATRRDLITAVSHDLRTPIASLRAMIEAIDDRVVDDPAEVRRYVGEMRRSILQLSAMVDDLFELAQVESGAVAIEARRIRLADAIGAAVEVVRPQAELKRLSLRADIGAAADTPCSPALVRVLQNLLVNAVRHTPADGTVRIEAANGDGSLEVAVEDTGEGIASEDLPLVFDVFYRSDRSRSGPGAGLGLAVSKRIVESMGGTIGALSTPRVGSRFWVRLPAG
jgi:signal transduction histidine kinase